MIGASHSYPALVTKGGSSSHGASLATGYGSQLPLPLFTAPPVLATTYRCLLPSWLPPPALATASCPSYRCFLSAFGSETAVASLGDKLRVSVSSRDLVAAVGSAAESLAASMYSCIDARVMKAPAAA